MIQVFPTRFAPANRPSQQSVATRVWVIPSSAATSLVPTVSISLKALPLPIERSIQFEAAQRIFRRAFNMSPVAGTNRNIPNGKGPLTKFRIPG